MSDTGGILSRPPKEAARLSGQIAASCHWRSTLGRGHDSAGDVPRASGRKPLRGSIPFSVLTQAADGQGRRAAAKRSRQ